MAGLISEATQRIAGLFRSKSEISEVSETAKLAGAILDLVPELRESLSQADVELALEDRGWINFGQRNFSELTREQRISLVERSRFYYLRDPLAKQAVRLWTNYGVGTGINYELADDEESTKAIDKFFTYRRNKRFTSSQGQQWLSTKLLTDGELFFVIVEGEPPVIRLIDCLQITEIISDPDDQEEILGYKRVFQERDGQDKTLYYADWAADEDKLSSAKDSSGNAITFQDKMVIYHHPFDRFGKRGNGLLSSVLDWSRETRRFMQARVALTQSLAKFAHKITAKGGQATLDALKKRMESSYAASGLAGGIEKNPSPASASNFFQNLGLDIEAMPRTTGAGDAKQDADNLKLMVCSGAGIMQHYFGDPSTGNLATAEAMELPMLKQFAAYQELWKDFWRDIFSLVLQEDIDEDPVDIEIYLPQILKDDLVKLGTYVTALTTAFPECKVPDVLRPLLSELPIDDLDDVMKEIAANKVIVDQQQKDKIDALKNQPQPSPDAVAATNKLAEAILAF